MRRIKILFFNLFLLFLSACAPVYTINHSAPINPVSLPADEAAHYWAQEEWWYYTGHLKAEDGREFGYEVTFFKRLTNEDNVPEIFIPIPAYWFKNVAMLGHFAVTDLQNNKFKAEEINDFVFNSSRADEKKYDLMIDTWTAREENGKHILHAEMDGYTIDLELEALKPAAFHEHDGIVNKGANRANYYYSFTNMKTSGTLTVDGQPLKVEGKSWTDHEYGTIKLAPSQSGWDWFSVRLDNNCELMIYLIRNDENGIIDAGFGTFVLPDGKAIRITKDDIDIKSQDYWYSEHTEAKYPASWDITVKPLNLSLAVKPVFEAQELHLKPLPYWEGSVRISGTYNNMPVQGRGYVELVGYSKKYPLSFLKDE